MAIAIYDEQRKKNIDESLCSSIKNMLKTRSITALVTGSSFTTALNTPQCELREKGNADFR